LPPGQKAVTNIFGRPFQVVEGSSFAHLYQVFFQSGLYDFECSLDSPYIIDCGANIGVSVMWWKTRFPNAKVIAFEADPQIFQILQMNCAHLGNVQMINAAVWDKEGELPFTLKGDLGGHMAEFGQSAGHNTVKVPCLRLRSFLADKCSFLKMDIEGAETEVLRDCAQELKNVDRAFIEYHSFVGRPQFLAQTVSVLEAAGFRLHVHTEMPSPRPFRELVIFNEKDVRLDLFCYRSSTRPPTLQC
jgi:FkbM family methyltransferase